MKAMLSTLLVIAALSAPAYAQKSKAKEYYRQGVQSYNLTEYEKALVAFTAGYREVEDAVFLFNIAQCHRQLGHKAEAIKVYRSFLRVAPNTPNAPEVKNLIARLENELAVEQANKNQPPQSLPGLTGDTPPAVVPVSKPVETPVFIVANPGPKKPLYKRPWFWGAVAGGAVVVAGAIVLGVVLSPAPTPNPTFGSVSVP